MQSALAPSALHVWLSQDAASAAASSSALILPMLLPLLTKRAGTRVTKGGAASVMSGGARSVVLNVDGLLSVGEGG
jgi:hypothetical protein